jgi:hypothetical protein
MLKRFSMPAHVAGLALALGLALAGRPAAAAVVNQDLDFVPEGWFVPVGVNVGLSLHDQFKNSYLVGGEASLVYLENSRMMWGGGFVDGLWDDGSGTYRFCAGPEFGVMFGGVELGYLVERYAEEWYHGLRAGVVATVAFLSIYGRVGFLFGGVDESTFGEFGVLVKFPLPLEI